MSNCIWIEVDEGADVWKENTRRARKPHKCCECDGTIAPGSLYVRIDMLYDGAWSHDDTCARCDNLWREYARGGREIGGLVEYWWAAFGFDYRDGIPPDFAPCRPSEKGA